MVLIGLTGGIGSGKSAVGAVLSSKGYRLVDADLVARYVVEAGSPTLAQIVDAFGVAVLSDDGTLDRPKLGGIVFGDKAKLELLNSIIHPAIAVEMKRRIAQALEDDIKGAVFIDIPLLVETGAKDRYHLDYVVVVDVPMELQLYRLVHDRMLDEEEARARIDAQAKRDDRLAAADFVIENTGSLEDLAVGVEEMLKQLHGAIGAR